MPPQPVESRLTSLEERVTRLEELPARIDDLTSQVFQLRTEMRDGFSAVRAEFSSVRAEFSAELSGVQMGLRAEIAEQGARLSAQMRMLHEDVIARLALLQEGRPRPGGQ
jgi:hypothetical protein